jgi:hypothetical protein
MFKKTILIILSVLFLSLSTINLVALDPPIFEYLKPFYSEILFEDLENYDYTTEEIGNDFYLVKINGVIYIVQK